MLALDLLWNIQYKRLTYSGLYNVSAGLKQYSTLNYIMLALDLLWISDESVVVLLVLLSLR